MRLLGGTVPSTPPSAEAWLSPTAGLSIDLETTAPHKRLRLHGELDLATAALLASQLDRHAVGCETLQLDLSDLRFCDLVGLSTLEQAQQRLRQRGCWMTVHGIHGQLRRLLAVEGLRSPLANDVLVGNHEPVASSAGSKAASRATP
jgi:anti-sigma B factor antagonist